MEEIVLEEADKSLLATTYARNLRYLYEARSPSERSQSGYLKMRYSLDCLERITRFEPIIVAKVGGRVVGHYYPMPDYFRVLIGELRPTLEMFEKVQYMGRPVTTYRFFEILQILVEGEFQRRGIARKLVEDAKRRTAGQYDLLIVKIAAGNDRSLKFHTSVGFRPIALITTDTKKLHILAIDLRPAPKL